jgi:uncharacterized protein
MLCFDIRSLESHAVQVDAELAVDDPVWESEGPRPAEPVRVTGRLSPAGPGRFYFSGRLESTTAGECRRCLTDVTTPVSDEVHLFFAEEGDETAEDDPDVYLIDADARELDLRPAIRESYSLVAPAYALCRDECKGLCPTCGADRNATDCGCPSASDGRWDALRSLRDASE